MWSCFHNWITYWSEDRWLSKVGYWHFYLSSCKGIVDNWEKILEAAYPSYQRYLADPKPKKKTHLSDYQGDGGNNLDEEANVGCAGGMSTKFGLGRIEATGNLDS